MSKFSDLRIGDTFQFALGMSRLYNGPWSKVSPKKYKDIDGGKTFIIGSCATEVVKMEVEPIATYPIIYTRHECYLFMGGKKIVILISTDTMDKDALFLMFEDCDVAKQLGFTDDNMTRTYKVPGEPDTFRARESACKGHFLQVGIRLHNVMTFSV